MVIICEWIITPLTRVNVSHHYNPGEASYHGGSVTRFLPRFVYLPPTLGLTSESPFYCDDHRHYTDQHELIELYPVDLTELLWNWLIQQK